MTFQILEQFVEAKTDDRVCEDMLVVTDDFVAMIDGASDATGARFGDKAGGRLAAETLAVAIEALPADADARLFADALSQTLTTAVAAVAGELDNSTRWPVAVVTCVSAHRRQVWRIGDGNLVIAGTSHPATLAVDDIKGRFRAAVNTALVNTGMSLTDVIENDPGASGARLLGDIQQHLANKVGPWGYGCINGSRVPDEYLEVFAIAPGPTEVIITSDGFPAAMATLAQSQAALDAMIERDPGALDEFWSMTKPAKPGSNGPDDRAYLRFIVD